jgi:hypothetical protein
MTVLVDTLRPLMAPGVVTATARNAKPFQQLLRDRKKGFYAQCGSGQWSLEFCEKERLAGYLAYDSNRMGCAAFQSFETARIGMKDPLRMPWALIQAYYAAYYAGHSVLCAFGRNSKHLDVAFVSYLNSILSAQSVALLSIGLHLVTAEPSGTGLTLLPLSSGAVKGGAHERFWETFHEEIRRVGRDVLTVSAPQQDVQAASTKLTDLLFAMGGPPQRKAWLSQVRNDIQYKHERNVWFFTGAAKRPDATALCGIMNCWRGDPMAIELRSQPDDLRRFVASCTFLVSLCRAVLEEVGRYGTFQPKALAFPSL